MKTKTLSTESASSTTYPVRNSSALPPPEVSPINKQKSIASRTHHPEQMRASFIVGKWDRLWNTTRSRASISTTNRLKRTRVRLSFKGFVRLWAASPRHHPREGCRGFGEDYRFFGTFSSAR